MITDQTSTIEGLLHDPGRAPDDTVIERALIQPACIHQWFEAHAQRNPEQVVLVLDRRQLTYRQLNEQANRLARFLGTLGVGPGIPVGICLERSVEMIVAVLGVLKAGAAYVPFDPGYPRQRLAFMLEDASCKVLLTERRLSINVPGDGCTLIYLDEVEAALACFRDTNPDVVVSGDDPAYIIYTSGSTGPPKGVVVEHRHVVHSTLSRLRYYDAPVERFALIPSLAFDSSVATIFWTLSQGGTLCLPPHGAEREAAGMAGWIEANRITHWLSVPSLYKLLLQQPAHRLVSLKTVIVGGDICTPDLVRRHQALLPSAALYNEYGPTEATVWSTVFHCRGDLSDRTVPIGRPIPNMRAYVLDAAMNPVPIGVPGELYVAGAGVARGYHRRPELTAARFMTDPFAQHGARMYKTGDLARWLADGNLEFLGRTDTQVTIRGCRVELGEIEAALCRHTEIGQAVVSVQRGRGGRDQLVAYLVARGRLPSRALLRRWLRDTLPDHMIPAYFLVLDALPLTANGKIDHRALGLRDRGLPAREQVDAVPCDAIERRLAAIWQRVFASQPINPCDDFFELGGDSLLAAGLFAMIEREFGHILSLDVLFERPTVRLLAALLRAPASETAKSRVVTIQEGRSGPPLFCLPGIGGNVLEFRRLADRLGPAQKVVGLPPSGLGDGRAPDRTIGEMATDAICQMRTVQPHGPYYLVGYSLGGVVAFEVAQQLRASGEVTELLALLDSRLWAQPVRLSTLQRLRLHWQNLYHSSQRGRWQYLRQRGRVLAARIRRASLRARDDDLVTTLDLSPASRRIAQIHWQALRTYKPRVYDGQITFFVAKYDQELCAAGSRDPTLGWAPWTTLPVQTYLVAGTHAELIRSKELGRLASCICGSGSSASHSDVMASQESSCFSAV